MGLYIGYNLVTPATNYGNSEEFYKVINGTISSVTIPNSITDIREYAFYSCSNLTNVIIPDSVNTIGTNAFGNCANLTNITIDQYENSISGAPWGATNATINWKIMPNPTIDLSEYSFTMGANETILDGYIGSDTEIVLPVVEG